MNSNNRRYEYAMVIMFFFTWGLVFMDRLAISYLFPTIQRHIHVTNTDVGIIGFVTAACFAVSSIVFGTLADKMGYKKRFIVPFLLGTAVFSAAGVFTHTIEQLIIVRALVGFCEGPIAPLLYSALSVISSKDTFGRNCGVLNAGVGAIGATFGPVFITQLVAHFSWQYTFLLSSLPTFVMCALIAVFMKEIRTEPEVSDDGQIVKRPSMLDIFKYRNVVLCIIINIMVMCGYWTLMLFAPLYLVNISHFSVQTMGWVSSIMGILYIIYSILIPKLSDNFGRKPLLVVPLVLSIITPAAMFFFPGNLVSAYLYVAFGGVIAGVCPLFMNIIPLESVPLNLRATVGAVIQGFGDFLGAACWPILAGRIADAKGLPFMMLMAALLVTVAFITSVFVNETHPRRSKETGINLAG